MKNSPKIWTTHDGTAITIDSLSDQHLSNIYWFFTILYGQCHLHIQNEIFNRFGKEIPLPFKPLNFPGELAALKYNIIGNDIVYKGMVVGSIEHLELCK